MYLRDKSIFPPALEADENGFVAFSRDLDCEMLKDAYAHGIFPWPFGEGEEFIPWVSPLRRGVLFMEEFHVHRSWLRELKKSRFTFKVDTAFEEVVEGCAHAVRPGQEGTWITGRMKEVYAEFHRMGYAHSFEAFDENGCLAGGSYGVSVGRIFCGESMFYRVSGASRFAFIRMVGLLKDAGVRLIDTQMVTNATAAFGAREIANTEYLKLLDEYGGPPRDFRMAAG